MSEQSVKVPVNTLVEFMLDALAAMGISDEDAKIIANVIITSDFFGVRSHGIAHLKMYYDRIKKGLQLPKTNITVVKDTPTTAVLDGGNGMGMVIGHHAMKMAIEKAKQNGLGAVAVRNSSHYGVAGYYPLMAVKEGLVGLSVTNAHPSIAPTFGVKPMLGTNPIAVAAPSDEAFPYMFDAATSVVPRGKIEVYARGNKPLPEGWVINQDGVSATESNNMIKQMDLGNVALLPVGGLGEMFGGHKGYGLATMVEIFSAAFQDGTYLWGLTDEDSEGNSQFLRIGHFFMAINIENFIPLATFKKITGNIMRDLRNSPISPDQSRVFTAGEKEYINTQKVLAEGVEIPPAVQKNLLTLQAELGLSRVNLGF
ncbi:MAG: Ldh family oxidoreductase [Anaerolineaceae bacterium]|nr:Ldh family oxidoreductase [Anaerolineaceae bacterium]